MKKALGLLMICAVLLSACGGQSGAATAGTLPGANASVTREESGSTGASTPTEAVSTTVKVTTTAELTTTPEVTATKEPATPEPTTPEPTTPEPTTPEPTTPEPTTPEPTTPEPTTPEPTTPEPTTPEPTTQEPTTPEPTTPEPTQPPTAAPATVPSGAGLIVCIDPGHQARANLDTEPQGPGSDIMKAKVSDGTRGVSSGIRESVVNLTIALQLRDELLRRGYQVVMTRTSEEVDISNIERAQLANNSGAQAFLRLHCDSGDPSWSGTAIYCQHPYSDFNGYQYANSRRLCEILLEQMCRATGAQNRGVVEAYHYTGINWSKVPGGLIEMGFLSNAAEEQKLLDPAYQQLLVQAMADALDIYFNRN